MHHFATSLLLLGAIAWFHLAVPASAMAQRADSPGLHRHETKLGLVFGLRNDEGKLAGSVRINGNHLIVTAGDPRQQVTVTFDRNVEDLFLNAGVDQVKAMLNCRVSRSGQDERTRETNLTIAGPTLSDPGSRPIYWFELVTKATQNERLTHEFFLSLAVDAEDVSSYGVKIVIDGKSYEFFTAPPGDLAGLYKDINRPPPSWPDRAWWDRARRQYLDLVSWEAYLRTPAATRKWGEEKRRAMQRSWARAFNVWKDRVRQVSRSTPGMSPDRPPMNQVIASLGQHQNGGIGTEAAMAMSDGLFGVCKALPRPTKRR